MNILLSLVLVGVLYLVVLLGVGVLNLGVLFGVVIPYVALVTFIVGFIYRMVKWAKSPQPFRIPTTCGQQKSLDWIKANNLEAPHNTFGLIGRMALEVLFFRSLFRNTRAHFTVEDENRPVYGWTGWLWFFALMFHWSFLVIVIRHLRLFSEPVPAFIGWVQALDGFLQVGLPTIFLSSFALLGAATFLFLRRVVLPNIRYISLIADYFPLFVIMTIAATGILMRHFTKVDIVAVKELTMGLMTFNPVVPETLGSLFFAHLFFVCVLMIYFPFSKLMHMGGIFMSPTRNMLNNNRAVRYINPWNPKVKTHDYDEWEDEFREKMQAVGLPTEKD